MLGRIERDLDRERTQRPAAPRASATPQSTPAQRTTAACATSVPESRTGPRAKYVATTPAAPERLQVSELFKAAMAGAWTWVITYLFPSSLAIGLSVVTLLTLEPASAAAKPIDGWSAGYRTVVAVGVAVLLAMTLAGLNNGLHRVLEGYVLVPRSERLWNYFVDRQSKRKSKLESAAASSTSSNLRKALLRERLEDFPADPAEHGPTRYSNSVRALETYAVTRFKLDSQYLWGELTACTPEAARTAEEDARSFVDFLVNLMFVSVALCVGSMAIAIVECDWRWLLVSLGFGILAWVWNRLIHAAVRSWRSAVRAVVDLGRAPSPPR